MSEISGAFVHRCAHACCNFLLWLALRLSAVRGSLFPSCRHALLLPPRLLYELLLTRRAKLAAFEHGHKHFTSPKDSNIKGLFVALSLPLTETFETGNTEESHLAQTNGRSRSAGSEIRSL